MTWIRKFVTYAKMTLSSGKKKSDAILHKNNEKKGFWRKFFFSSWKEQLFQILIKKYGHMWQFLSN